MDFRTTIRQAFIRHFKLEGQTLTDGTRLADTGIDSLSLAEFLFALEDDYGLPSFEAPSLPETFGELLALADQIPADAPAGVTTKAA